MPWLSEIALFQLLVMVKYQLQEHSQKFYNAQQTAKHVVKPLIQLHLLSLNVQQLLMVII
jgi:hypothetical protein